jgi:hypothetical protein
MTDKQAGGVDWELSEAERLMLEAQTPEDRVLAMRRHTEAIRNMMQNSLVPSYIAALGGVLDKKLQPIAAWLERSDRARLDKDAGLQEQLDARLDAIGATVDRIENVVSARPAQRAAERAEIDARFDRKRERLEDHDRRLSDHEERIRRLERGDGKR